ncbi:hypothetical protein A3A05_02975 [Candidatus Nomurabacteria bacterium RIFCSPLOWO2_01_FULL_41_12]|uniref:Endolytic murein transglycosylase n=1 Tax=Candidatus Nomurabacteria bacterium RIFCSPLOWO2_01_FULL_41_12 TaxID=1801774 RepID=A0A1F6WX81_9BACT|nr:MAG: hypothetical protein A2732_01465 [Candidatus Nomurabacteria bacterium RIFCSPHIGHO2_01_FULL_40_10]OGI86488.1 MAG: hypothetical protein A3A05_02975 [Candidatus Nomurabacteria bacterium RIFCSPLOWO2_01_FULL_41_12]
MQNKYHFYVLGALFFLIFFTFFFVSAPRNFPEGIVFNVAQGSSLRSVSFELKNQNIIRSRLVFEAFVIIYGGEKHIIPADYLFENKISSREVAKRISKGERHLAPVKVTIPEGFTVYDIADTFALKLSYFNKDKFLNYAKDKEGYLFPDTYFFFTTANEEDVLKSLTDNFKKKISMLENEIINTGKSEGDIIKMASLLERESKGSADRDIISGILWKRLSIGMSLQADAAPETYKKLGLPANPICNPGLLSIKAAIYPKSTPYLYYLHDKDGNIYYAKSFTEHRKNILKYLK